jgi:transcriptional regulator with XRE-family HTH domain
MPRQVAALTTHRSPTNIDAHVGGRLRDRRITLGMSKQALAETLGVTYQQLQKYEKGTNRLSASRLYQLAHVLNMPIPRFFEGIDGGAAELQDSMRNPEILRFVREYHRIKGMVARARFRRLVASLGAKG